MRIKTALFCGFFWALIKNFFLKITQKYSNIFGFAVVLPASGGAQLVDNFAVVAQLVEHVLGKNEVIGSIPINGSCLPN